MSRRVRWVGLVAVATILLACNSILGLTDFAVTPDPADASDDRTMGNGDGSCADGGTSDADLAVVCYPCNPLTTEQLLNACTGAQCIPFDRARLTNLLPDGGMPPLPPGPDGG
ncbi:MAG: hypothetical protein NVS3B10_02110 [Polyangiales bacterium]